MNAKRLMGERHALGESAFAELRIWRVPQPVRASSHLFKYALALVVERVCVLRYDNEAGKGDHRHVGDREFPYEFISPERLLADVWKDVDEWLGEAER